MPKKGFWRELLQGASEGARAGTRAYFQSGGKASAGFSELMNNGLPQKQSGELRRRLKSGQSVLRATHQVQPPMWVRREITTGTHGQRKLNVYTGYLYTKRLGPNGTLADAHVHAVFDMQGQLQYVRDMNGHVHFDRSKGHTPPVKWESFMPR